MISPPPPADGLLRRIDHVGVAVEDLDAAIATYERSYGARVVHREEMVSDGVVEALLGVGDGYVQLLQPTTSDSPVARFLARKGSGVHHVAYGVDDVDETLRHLRAQGVRTLDEVGRPGSRGTTIAFVHPRDGLGVLIELVQDPARAL